MTISKQDFIRLAKGYIAQAEYDDDVLNAIMKAAEKHGVDSDFIGPTCFYGPAADAIRGVLGEDFAYWFFDCNKSFSKFNKGTTYSDGSHPNVQSLEDLYELSFNT